MPSACIVAVTPCCRCKMSAYSWLCHLLIFLPHQLQTTTTIDRFEVSSFSDKILTLYLSFSLSLSLSDLSFLFLHFSLQFLSLFGHVLLIVILRITGYFLAYCFTGLHNKTPLNNVSFFMTFDECVGFEVNTIMYLILIFWNVFNFYEIIYSHDVS